MSLIDMSDDEWVEYHNYADRVTIVIGPASQSERSDEEEWNEEEWIVVAEGAAWSQDWLIRQVESITSTEIDGKPVHLSYILDTSLKRTSWGAAGATYEIVLLIAQWAAASFAWDGLKAIAQRMDTKLREERLNPIEPLTDQEVESRARWVISSRYHEDFSELEIKLVEIVDQRSATVILTSKSGWTYECNIGLETNLAFIGRIKKYQC